MQSPKGLQSSLKGLSDTRVVGTLMFIQSCQQLLQSYRYKTNCCTSNKLPHQRGHQSYRAILPTKFSPHHFLTKQHSLSAYQNHTSLLSLGLPSNVHEPNDGSTPYGRYSCPSVFVCSGLSIDICELMIRFVCPDSQCNPVHGGFRVFSPI